MTKTKYRTLISKNKSPGNFFIYQICKYLARFSTKDWAKGEKYAAWVMVEKGVEKWDHHDLKSIHGSRNGIFFLNSLVICRIMDNLKEFLAQEQVLHRDETGGITRDFILQGALSPAIHAFVRAKGLLHSFIYQPWITSLTRDNFGHVCDQGAKYRAWSKKMAELADDPTLIMNDPTACIEAGPRRVNPDVEKIISDLNNDPEARERVESLLKVACKAASEAIEHHTIEHSAEGRFKQVTGGTTDDKELTEWRRRRLDAARGTTQKMESCFATAKAAITKV